MKQPVTVSLKSVNPVSISHLFVVFACSHYLAGLLRIHTSGQAAGHKLVRLQKHCLVNTEQVDKLASAAIVVESSLSLTLTIISAVL